MFGYNKFEFRYDTIISCGYTDRDSVNSANLSKACIQANENCGADKQCIADQVKQMNNNGMYRFCPSGPSLSVTNGYWAYQGYGMSSCREWQGTEIDPRICKISEKLF